MQRKPTLQYLHFLNDGEILRRVIQCPHPSFCVHPVRSKGGFLMKQVFFLSLFFFSCPLFPSTLQVVIDLFCLPKEDEEEAHLAPQPIKVQKCHSRGPAPYTLEI